MQERIDMPEETQEQEQEAPTKYSLGGGVGAFLAMGAVDLFAHLGPTGLVVAAIVGIATYRHAPEVLEQIGKEIPLPKRAPKPEREQRDPGKLPLWQRALGLESSEVGDMNDTVVVETENLPACITDEIFSEEASEDDDPGMERITIEQAIAHTTKNSFKVFVGRSLTDDIGRARSIDFRGKHLKFIGASQRGKSSEVGALLTQMIATHTPDHVQIAPLDLEDRTGRLFADSPHVKRIRVDGQEVRLHARNVDQVLEYLTYITKFMDVRYKLPQSELERQPILIVYIEEFLRLRRSLKARISTSSPGAAREKAQRDYTRLLECIDALAARGLKARIQLWLCAQVDYVDPDLRDALANVVEGLSFCVKPTAAQAAGFTHAEYLARNHKQRRVGQAVIETTDLTDIIAAVEFPLAARLRDLDTVPVYTARETMPEMMFEVDTSDRRKIVSMVRDSGLPQREGDLRSYQDVGLASPQVPTYGMNEPVAQEDLSPGRDFEPGPGDGLVPDSQHNDLAYFYGKHGDVKKALREIGVGNQCYRHAAWLLEQRGLKTIRRA